MYGIDLSLRWSLLVAVLVSGLSGCAFSRTAPQTDSASTVPMVMPPASAGGIRERKSDASSSQASNSPSSWTTTLAFMLE